MLCVINSPQTTNPFHSIIQHYHVISVLFFYDCELTRLRRVCLSVEAAKYARSKECPNFYTYKRKIFKEPFIESDKILRQTME